mgnify:CR=1 FL=1
MQSSQTKKLFSTSSTDLLWTTGLTMAVVIAPALLAHTPQNQWITGTIVNASFFISAWKLGIVNALLIAIIPSSIALTRGLLLPPQVIIIPYIIISNAILISVFATFKKQLLTGVLLASFLKFAFIAGIVSLLFVGKLPTIVIQMMQWPQLITAVAGGFIAIIFIKQFSKS